MKKLLGFVILCIPLYVCGSDNLIFNPGFDMTPWDTGWTITLGGYCAHSEDAVPDTSAYYSFPQSAKLSAEAYGYDPSAAGRSSSSAAIMSQEIHPATDCTCKVYYKDYFGCYLGESSVSIFVKVNGVWNMEFDDWWESDTIWTKWEKVYDSSDTVSGIKFSAHASGGPPQVASGWAILWVDDVHISGEEVGVEEDSRLQMANYRVEISPNPFIQSTTIKYHLPTKSKVSLKIYDITGRIVKTLVNKEKEAGNYNISFSAKDLTAGIYFAKLVAGDFKKTNKLTVLK